jgi:hypothetical protein
MCLLYERTSNMQQYLQLLLRIGQLLQRQSCRWAATSDSLWLRHS